MTNQNPKVQLIEDWLSKQGFRQPVEITHLLGDGSSRSFYRVVSPNQNSYILLSDPDWKLTQDYPAHQTALKAAGIPVPEFIASDPSQGFLLMQDLGDELLQLYLVKNPEQKVSWLRKAVELLANLHGKLFPVSASLPVSQRRFDEEKYFQELCFTFEHLREKYLKLPPVSKEGLAEVRRFCAGLDSFKPWVFCHRDYHCRNLLVHKDSLWMIDFQDARLGPPAYDLASILYDAYFPLPEDLRTELLAVYKKTLSSYSVFSQIDWKAFEKELGLVAYQRTLKAAGSFASFFNRFQKKTHLPYLKPALQMARELEIKWGIAQPVATTFEIEKMIGLLHGAESNL
jgi:aminoglycoside/choline kinase family phosphotransferase